MRRLLEIVLVLVCVTEGALAASTFPPSSTPTMMGVDVSAWQGTIDWAKVRASGVEVAMIRASEGSDYVDPAFERNWAGAKASGIAVGCYHYLTAQTVAEAIAQADFFASVVSGKTPDCLLALDYGGGARLTDEQLTACASAFLARVEEKTGYHAMLYTDAWAAKARYGSALAAYPIWVANYGVTLPEANGKWTSWVGFQYSDRGRISGVSGNIDLDHFTKEVYQSAPGPTPTPLPVADSLYWAADQNISLPAVAKSLSTTALSLEGRNEIVGQRVQAGQVLRYPALQNGSGASFAGVHILRQKESLATLARHYGTTVAALVSLNAFSSTSVPVGQVVRIPAVPSRSDVPAPPSWLLENVVIVQSGQTISVISALYGIPLQTLCSVNGLTSSDTVYPGQLLHLQAYGKGTIIGFSGGYVVQHGDTLTRIANHFHTTATKLYQINNIAFLSLIYPGQVLLLPAITK